MAQPEVVLSPHRHMPQPSTRTTQTRILFFHISKAFSLPPPPAPHMPLSLMSWRWQGLRDPLCPPSRFSCSKACSARGHQQQVRRGIGLGCNRLQSTCCLPCLPLQLLLQPAVLASFWAGCSRLYYLSHQVEDAAHPCTLPPRLTPPFLAAWP